MRLICRIPHINLIIGKTYHCEDGPDGYNYRRVWVIDETGELIPYDFDDFDVPDLNS